MKTYKKALTFEDILLVPKYSSVLPRDVDVRTKLTKNITLSIPIISAAMDTVTEHEMAIMLARLGGIGVIHKNMDIKSQAKEIEKVKKNESGIIVDPIFVKPYDYIGTALKLMREYKISGVPVVDDDGILVGILTNRDLRFETNFNKKVKDDMTKMPLITAIKGATLEEAKDIFHKYKIEKLPIVNEEGKLTGLITIKDLIKRDNYPCANKDSFGRLRVAGGVSTMEFDRIEALIQEEVDVLVIDSAHAHSKKVFDTVKFIKNNFKVDLIVGNVVTKDATRELIDLGADAIKVGIGSGSICTTRIVAGVGVPQASAIDECVEVAREYDIPIISDGGIRYSGDIAKALALGASSIMIGSLFAGTKESPGDIVVYEGRQYKIYRGMGSIEAMKSGSKGRYFQDGVDNGKLVPEGIEGRVPYRGRIQPIIDQMIGGLKSSMGYVGAKDLKNFCEVAQFIEITLAGLKESHVHDVVITKEAPNYHI